MVLTATASVNNSQLRSARIKLYRIRVHYKAEKADGHKVVDLRKAEIYHSFIWVHKHGTAALDGNTEKPSSLLRVLKISQQHTEQSQWRLDDII